MAINVNTVYTTVLSILNKEQRGYFTPDEFNKAATQAQLDVFENYFINMDKQLVAHQSNFDYSNPETNIDDELSIFKCFGSCVMGGGSNFFTLPAFDLITNNQITYNDVVDPTASPSQFAFYRLGTVVYGSGEMQVERLQRGDFYTVDRSDLTKPSENFPVYLYENNQLRIKPTSITDQVSASFIRKPLNVKWGFSVSNIGAYIYEPTMSQDFEVSSNKQTELILDIIKYAGVVLRDSLIVQSAAQELAQREANTKK